MRTFRLAATPLLFAASALAQAPSYNTAGFLNACDLSTGPYAPNKIVAVYGSNLAWSTYSLTANDIKGGALPTSLNGVQVVVNNVPAPLFMVSSGQVNFLMPTDLIAGPVTVRVVRQNVTGPEASIIVQDAAPALFPSPAAAGYAIAQLWPRYSAISPDSPAPPGGIVILYAAGLGRTRPYPSQSSEIPFFPGKLEAMQDFRVLLNGKPLDSARVLYAGLAPGWASLYQVNLVLPDDVGPDPEIRLAAGSQLSASGIKLAVRAQ